MIEVVPQVKCNEALRIIELYCVFQLYGLGSKTITQQQQNIRNNNIYDNKKNKAKVIT